MKTEQYKTSETHSKKLTIDEILSSNNVAEELSDDQLSDISLKCIEGYDKDVQSRAQWEERMFEAMKLALQIREPKNFPWANCSNVKFPLISIAAIQFNHRVMPGLLSGTDVVRMRVVGEDAQGQKAARAKRVSEHMSYQVLDQDENWYDETDTMMLSIPILGCGFKKSFFDSDKQYNVAYNVFPGNLVIDYYATSLEDAERITEVIEMSERDILSNQRMGLFRKADLGDSQQFQRPGLSELKDEVHGTTAPNEKTTRTLLEQHCHIDLDGDDYPEPYIVTIDRSSGEILRIVPRFESQDILYSNRPGDEDLVAKIKAEHYYTRYIFIPSPDGGIYGLGFGVFLAPLNESINTSLNQLIDAGTLSVLPSGFIGRGARLKRGSMNFRPGEFKNINATGDDIRKSIFMLPVKEPSGTLFNLLSLLIEYGERISGVTDMMIGKTPGQNTPATTAMASLEQGMKTFSGIYGRMFRGLKLEFRRRYELNARYLDPKEYFETLDPSNADESVIFQEDYQGDPKDVRPTADPEIASDMQRMTKAEALKQSAMQSGMYNMYEVERRYLEALKIPGIDQVLPKPGSENAPQPPRDLKAEAAMMKVEIEANYKAATLQADLDVKIMQAAKLEADAILALARAEAAEEGIQMDQYKAVLDTMRENRESLKQAREQAINAQQQQSQKAGQSPEPEIQPDA